MDKLLKRVRVRDVETRNYGRAYAGRTGEIRQYVRNPDTMEMTSYVVRMDDPADEVTFKPEEVEILD